MDSDTLTQLENVLAEAKHVQRRCRLLVQMTARAIDAVADEIDDSPEEDTRDRDDYQDPVEEG